MATYICDPFPPIALIGYDIENNGKSNTILGLNSVVNGDRNIVFGLDSIVKGNNNIVVGTEKNVEGDGNIVIHDFHITIEELKSYKQQLDLQKIQIQKLIEEVEKLKSVSSSESDSE